MARLVNSIETLFKVTHATDVGYHGPSRKIIFIIEYCELAAAKVAANKVNMPSIYQEDIMTSSQWNQKRTRV